MDETKREDVEITFIDTEGRNICVFTIIQLPQSVIPKINSLLEEYYAFHPFDEGYFKLFEKGLHDKFIKEGAGGGGMDATIEIEGATIIDWKIRIIHYN